MFEFANKNAIFGVITPDSFLWAPILGLFALTGIPTSGMLRNYPNTNSPHAMPRARLFVLQGCFCCK